MVIEGGATEKLGVATASSQAASRNRNRAILPWNWVDGNGGAGVMRAGGIDCSCLGGFSWNAGKGCWSRSGTVTVGLLRLGDGRLEPTGGREDNVSGGQSGVNTPCRCEL